jgi:hypothetical protein
MSIRIFIASIAIVAVSFGDMPSKEAIDKLIVELDSPRFQVREEAAKSLRKLGEPSVGALAKEARYGSAESAATALRLLAEFANCNDKSARAAARKSLTRLAEIDGKLGGEAKQILNRSRNEAIAKLTDLKVEFSIIDDEVLSVDFYSVVEIELGLELLKEIPESQSFSAMSKRFTGKHTKALKDLPNLREANLFQSNIGNEGLQHLAEIKTLKRLPMGRSGIDDEGMPTIGKMTHLEYLGLRTCSITDAGAKHLANLTDLRTLFLAETKITDDGLKHLKGLTKLQTLYLFSTDVSDAGLEHLHGLRDLHTLYLGKTRVTEAGIAKLKAALPDVQIVEYGH